MRFRAANKSDIADLFEMLVELAVIVCLDTEIEITCQQFAKDFEEGCFKGFVLLDNEAGQAAGMVIFHYTYNCWKGKIISVDQLVVRSEYRNMKYGKLLFAAVAQEANDRGVSCITWHVIEWNKDAIEFCNSVAGNAESKNHDGVVLYKLKREGIEQFVASTH